MWSVSKTVMAVPDPRRAGSLLLLCSLCLACVAPPPPPAKPAEEKPAPEAPAETPAPAATPAPAEEPKAKAPYGDDVIVLDSGGQEAGAPKSLADAARAEREKRAHAKPPIAVITNQTLKESKGQVTFVNPPPKKAGEEKPVADAPAEPLRDEAYWRSRALDIRLRWRKAADEVKELEQSSAGWRRRFYAENDPYVRNGQIKPEWDRVLDRLEEARADVETAKKELEELMEEGRLAGALPGWLREGLDEEPKEEPKPSDTHKVIDPPVVDEDGRNRA